VDKTGEIDFCHACQLANAQELYCSHRDCDPKNVVVVQVRGGNAELVKAPVGLKVVIVDYDNEN